MKATVGRIFSVFCFYIVLVGVLSCFMQCGGCDLLRPPTAVPVTPDPQSRVERAIIQAEAIFTGAQLIADFAPLKPDARAAVAEIFKSARKDLDKIEADARAGKVADETTILYVAQNALQAYTDYVAMHS